MSDLMSGTVNYSDLQKKYKNFMIPAIKIKVSGTDLVNSMKLAVVSMNMNLSTKSAGSCVITIAGLYDPKSHSLKSEAKSKFALGTIVTVELGYASSTECVFKGFVLKMGVSFTDKALLTVTLMDARRLMMTGAARHKLYDVKNYSDAVKEILSDYSKLGSTKIDATDDKLKSPVSQNSTDYDFITKSLIEEGRTDREFFIVADKIYFRKPRSEKSPITTMTYGKELLTFSESSEYKDLKIEVYGYDHEMQKQVKGSESVSKPSGQKSVLSKSSVMMIVDSMIDSDAKAGEKAKIIAKREEMRGNKASAMTIGLPQLIPGRFIKVSGLEGMADKSYYITDVEHVFTEDEFITRLEMTFLN